MNSTLSIKAGDLISVRYATSDPLDGSWLGWGEPFYGVVHEAGPVMRMWCLNDGTVHTIMPGLDYIKIISISNA